MSRVWWPHTGELWLYVGLLSAREVAMTHCWQYVRGLRCPTTHLTGTGSKWIVPETGHSAVSSAAERPGSVGWSRFAVAFQEIFVFYSALCTKNYLNVISGFHRDLCNAEGFWVFQLWTILLLMTTFRGPWSASSAGRWNEKLNEPTKGLTRGGDLREAQSTSPRLFSHSCVWPHLWAQ